VNHESWLLLISATENEIDGYYLWICFMIHDLWINNNHDSRFTNWMKVGNRWVLFMDLLQFVVNENEIVNPRQRRQKLNEINPQVHDLSN
jgi:hypothetical protein